MDIVIVTDWKKVSADDPYLSEDWQEEINASPYTRSELQDMAKHNELCFAYEVLALNYVIYNQMDAMQVIIDCNGTFILHCESAVIGNNHKRRWAVDY
jgi:hypothetical protein